MKISQCCNLTKFCHPLIVLQLDGDCHCKSHVGGDSCDTCEDGYFALEKSNYFGCQGKSFQGVLGQTKVLMDKDWQRNLALSLSHFFYFLFFNFFCLFAFSRAAPMAYGVSQARGLIRAVAASLRRSHRKASATPQLRATPDR